MSRKKKRRKVYRYYRRKRSKKSGLWAYLGSKLLGICIIFLALVLVLYAFSFYKRVSQTEAKEQQNLVLARTQILNACEKEGLGDKVAHRLERMKVDNIVYEIMGIEKLKDSAPEESLILDRLADKEDQGPSQVALLTAEALGIPRRNVICKRLEDNYLGIWMTIVIGGDGEMLLGSN
jgi:hypothetical protein